jgi:hypothetical protein
VSEPKRKAKTPSAATRSTKMTIVSILFLVFESVDLLRKLLLRLVEPAIRYARDGKHRPAMTRLGRRCGKDHVLARQAFDHVTNAAGKGEDDDQACHRGPMAATNAER